MFIFNVKYKKPLAEVDKYLAEHRRYLDTLLEAGKLIASGSQEPRVGGIILCNARSEDEVREMVENDPFYIHGIADYEITCFHAIKHSADNFLAACE
ncbi:MAG: YciI family protein [Bacteroides sp.]|nr:YciI family protein [Ruminococcus flavefaciens]MCM1555706.1 YciI family protein [Bacteroides sp.]